MQEGAPRAHVLAVAGKIIIMSSLRAYASAPISAELLHFLAMSAHAASILHFAMMILVSLSRRRFARSKFSFHADHAFLRRDAHAADENSHAISTLCLML